MVIKFHGQEDSMSAIVQAAVVVTTSRLFVEDNNDKKDIWQHDISFVGLKRCISSYFFSVELLKHNQIKE